MNVKPSDYLDWFLLREVVGIRSSLPIWQDIFKSAIAEFIVVRERV